MKFNIIQALDLCLLNTEIANFIKENKTTPYIFMSDSTFKTISHGINYEEVNGIFLYRGCRVFVVDDLSYGDIDLR